MSNPFDPFGALLRPLTGNPLSEAINHLTRLIPAASFAIPFINSGVRRGLSIAEIHSVLTGMGLSIPHKTVAGLARSARSARAAAAYQNSLQGNELPNVNRFTASENLLDRNYVYHIKVNAIFNETGAVGVQYISISTDTLLTNDQLGEALDNIIATSAADYNMQVQSASVEQVFIDPRILP